ncbi:MAG: glycosyltransferase family 2 protein [Arenicella sp.]
MRYSVIIPTYNRQQRVLEAIQSVLQQGYEDLEIIVVDDGSIDDTAAVVAQFDSCCCHYVYQPNQGPAAARNLGLSFATGDIISFLDSDDLWLPGKIQHELDLFAQYPDVDAVAGNAESFVQGKLRTYSVFNSRKIDFPQDQPRPFCWSLPIMSLGPVCVTSSMALKKSVFMELGNKVFDEDLRFDEDWDFEFRLFSSYKVLLFNDIFSQIRAFDDGTRAYYSIWRNNQKSIEELQRIWTTQIKILERYLGHLDWDMPVQSRFLQRRNELQSLLNESIGPAAICPTYKALSVERKSEELLV